MSYEIDDDAVEAAYHPCRNGVHVCGQSSELTDGQFEYPVTLANVLAVDPRSVWEAGRQFAVPHSEADLVVDLVVNDDIAEDYSIRRQDLAALLQIMTARPDPNTQERKL